MANGDIILTGTISTSSDSDIYPTHSAKTGKGGYRSVQNIEERNSIPIERREIGMQVYVIEDEEVYILRNGIENSNWQEFSTSSKENAYSRIDILRQYLAETWYDYLNYDYANEYFEKRYPASIQGACSSVRNGSYYGRNLDWIYNEQMDFVVHTSAMDNRYATLGVASSIPGLTDSFVRSKEHSELYHIVPFMLVDGINEHNVIVNTNVVPADLTPKNNDIVPTSTEEIKLCTLMLPRYILDNFRTAREATTYIKEHAHLYHTKTLVDMGYEQHFMVADREETFLIEFVNNKVVIVDMTLGSNSRLADKPYMTNFHLYNVSFNADGKVNTPENQTNGSPIIVNNITPHGAGLERYNLIVDSYNTATTKTGMRNLMNRLTYSRMYRTAPVVSDPFWYSEYVGANGYDISNTPAEYDAIMGKYDAAYTNRSRDPESEFYGTWHTTHSAVYDIDMMKLYLCAQENSREYVFSLHNTDEDNFATKDWVESYINENVKEGIQVYSGTTEPSASLGKDGDFYVQTTDVDEG